MAETEVACSAQTTPSCRVLQLRQRRQPHRLGACALKRYAGTSWLLPRANYFAGKQASGRSAKPTFDESDKSRRNTADTAAGHSGDFASDSNSFTTAVLQGRKDASRVSFCMPASLSLNAPILHSYYRLSSSAKRPSCRQPALASVRPSPLPRCAPCYSYHSPRPTLCSVHIL